MSDGDFFNIVRGLGLGSRLKRMSDYLMSQSKLIYEDNNIEFNPKWFPLYSLLCSKKGITITEAASTLRVSHPNIIKLSKELENNGLIESSYNNSDGRSRVLSLTKKGKNLEKKLKPVWSSIQKCVEGAYPEIGIDFVNTLSKLEKYFENDSLVNRASKIGKRSDLNEIEIIPYDSQYNYYFEKLNRQWLERYFKVEDIDIEYFLNPKSKIIDKGGEIFFAKIDGKIVGTCALIKTDDQFELAKMAVDESFRGSGIGELLIDKSLEYASKNDIKSVVLVTNSTLKPAINLYLKKGFKVTHTGPHAEYERGDVVMKKNLID